MKPASAKISAMPGAPEKNLPGCEKRRGQSAVAAVADHREVDHHHDADLADQQDAEHLAGQFDVPVAQRGRPPPSSPARTGTTALPGRRAM